MLGVGGKPKKQITAITTTTNLLHLQTVFQLTHLSSFMKKNYLCNFIHYFIFAHSPKKL